MDRNPIKPEPIKLSWSRTTAKSYLEKLDPDARKLIEECADAFCKSLKIDRKY